MTWHGHLLYTFIKDSKDKVNGNGIGKVWYVAAMGNVSPGGGIAY